MPPIIEVKHLTKEYRLGSLTSIKDTFRQGLAKLTGKKDLAWGRERFKALDDVSFSIEEGEVVGIIGHNGAGKSTLLKHLANISTPTSGEIHVRGSVAPLIEVGAGLNPELTGRENIYLNGAILGISKKEIDKKLDEIIEFSELEQFIDTPVKRYSSGMTVKLGFSIATSIDADILIVDEVLAVGDLAFQRKCFNRMQSIINQRGSTVLIVGHNIRQLEQICSRMIMLNKGIVSIDDEPKNVCSQYLQQSNNKIKSQQATVGSIEESDDFELIGVKLYDNSGTMVDEIIYKDPFEVRVDFKLFKPVKKLTCFISIHTTDFVYVSANETNKTPQDFDIGEHYFEMNCQSMDVLPGIYSIKVWVGTVEGLLKFNANNLYNFQVVTNDFSIAKLQDQGLFQLDASFVNDAMESENR